MCGLQGSITRVKSVVYKAQLLWLRVCGLQGSITRVKSVVYKAQLLGLRVRSTSFNYYSPVGHQGLSVLI